MDILVLNIEIERLSQIVRSVGKCADCAQTQGPSQNYRKFRKTLHGRVVKYPARMVRSLFVGHKKSVVKITDFLNYNSQ